MDAFSRVIYGAEFGFGITIPAVILCVVIGVPIGLLAGYLDEILMRLFDGLRVFPSIILALTVVADHRARCDSSGADPRSHARSGPKAWNSDDRHQP